MSYHEPYQVVTSLPSTAGSKYTTGYKICYHYTLTYDEVVSKLKKLNKELDGNFDTPHYLNTIISSLSTGYAGFAGGVCILIAQEIIYGMGVTAKQYLEALHSTFVSIYNHMGRKNYNRVTLSQVMEVKYLMGGYYWTPVGVPKVPVEDYYWRV